MKNIMIFIFLIGVSLYTRAQNDIPWPPEDLRPDTITTYLFLNNSIPISHLPESKPTSNFSFKTRDFNMNLLAVKQSDMNDFVKRSLKGEQIIDTLNCTIFGEVNTAIVIKSKRKIVLYIFQDKKEEQDIFIATIKKKNKIEDTINYIAANLHE